MKNQDYNSWKNTTDVNNAGNKWNESSRERKGWGRSRKYKSSVYIYVQVYQHIISQ